MIDAVTGLWGRSQLGKGLQTRDSDAHRAHNSKVTTTKNIFDT
jgi:hypothetical protein